MPFLGNQLPFQYFTDLASLADKMRKQTGILLFVTQASCHDGLAKKSGTDLLG